MSSDAPDGPPARALAVVAAVVGACIGLTAGTDPTGPTLVDLVVSACFGAAIVVAATWARDPARTWLVVLAAIAGAAGGGPAALVGLAALTMHLIDLARPSAGAARRAGRLVVAALAATALLRIEGGPPIASALLVAVAAIPASVSAIRSLPEPARARASRAVLTGCTVFGLLLLVGIGAGVVAGSAVSEGIQGARSGFAAAREGDQAGAVADLRASVRDFEDAHAVVTAWWATPARWTPGVAHQIAALETSSRTGRDVSGAALAAAEVATVGELTLQDGALDLDAVRALEGPLAESDEVMEVATSDLASARTPWLGPLDGRLGDYQTELADARDELGTARQVLDVTPAVLGGEGTRRYLVLVGSPAETRELGGFVGNWVELEATDGRIRVTDDGRSANDLNDLLTATGASLDPAAYPPRYVAHEPGRFWQNITGSPDFPTVARAASELYGTATGRPVDLVLYLDPAALAGLLELTGPVRIEDLGRPLNRQNVADFLLRTQYLEVPDKAERIDLLGRAATAAFEQLTTSSLPPASEISTALGPAVDEDRLLLWSPRAEEQAVFARVGMDGAYAAPDGHDSLGLVTVNAGPSKLDPYLSRHLAYDVTFDPVTGATTATATVRLANEAPVDQLPAYVLGDPHGGPPGTNRTMVSLYSPLAVTRASLDGVDLPVETVPELGVWRHSLFISVPPGDEVEVMLSLAGSLTPGHLYQLAVEAQPVSTPDEVTVTVRGPHGVVDERTWSSSADRSVSTDVEAPRRSPR